MIRHTRGLRRCGNEDELRSEGLIAGQTGSLISHQNTCIRPHSDRENVEVTKSGATCFDFWLQRGKVIYPLTS